MKATEPHHRWALVALAATGCSAPLLVLGDSAVLFGLARMALWGGLLALSAQSAARAAERLEGRRRQRMEEVKKSPPQDGEELELLNVWTQTIIQQHCILYLLIQVSCGCMRRAAIASSPQRAVDVEPWLTEIVMQTCQAALMLERIVQMQSANLHCFSRGQALGLRVTHWAMHLIVLGTVVMLFVALTLLASNAAASVSPAVSTCPA